jgi:glycine/D-amino acid oxidase-like deaminating enzyme
VKSNDKFNGHVSNGGILVVGAGFAGLSVALELSNWHDDIKVIGTDNHSYDKNAGHVIPTMGESLAATIDIKGEKAAMDLQSHALKCTDAIVQWCTNNEHTILDRGYYVIPSDHNELKSLQKSKQIYNSKFDNMELYDVTRMALTPNFKDIRSLYMPTGWFGNPSMFRNSLANRCKEQGVTISKHPAVVNVVTTGSGVRVVYSDGLTSEHDAVVLCNNAFPLDLQKMYTDQFVGQIAVSHPITSKRLTPMAFSADHGYIYGQITVDNRLLIGGWRNNVKDDGRLDNINNNITRGLQTFVDDNFNVEVDLVNSEYEWRGAMAQTIDGLPIVGEIDTGIFASTGWNGYGFSQAHYTSTCLAKMIMEESLDDNSKQVILEYFNPKRFR